MTEKPEKHRAAIVFIVVTLLLDAIGFGLIMPVMPALLREVTGGDLAQAARWGGVLVGGFAVMQFLCGPVIGNLSDRFGRKPVLLASLGMLSGDYIILTLAGSVWVIFLARLINGAASSTYGTSMAYISDISTPQQKAQRFGLVGAAFGAGFVFGPAIGGLLAEYGVRAPFIAAAVVSALNMVFGALVMRESLKAEDRRPFDWRRANPFGAFRHVGKLPGLGRYLSIYTIHEFAFTVYPIIWAYFTIARFGWTPGQVGLSLAFYGVGWVFVQGVLIRVVIAQMGRRAAMMLGFIAGFVSFVMLVWLDDGFWALMMVPLSSLAGLVMPALRAEMSDIVPTSQQGELQGALASLHAVGMIVAPFVYTSVFALFAGEGALYFLPGAVFAIPAVLTTISFFLLRATPERIAT